MKSSLDDSVAWPKVRKPAKIVYSDSSLNSTIQKEPTRTLRSSSRNTTNEPIEKEPSRMCLRNRTVDKSSFLEQSSKSQSNKEKQSSKKNQLVNTKPNNLLQKKKIKDRPDLQPKKAI